LLRNSGNILFGAKATLLTEVTVSFFPSLALTRPLPPLLYIHYDSWFMIFCVSIFQHDSNDSASIRCNGIIAFISFTFQFNLIAFFILFLVLFLFIFIFRFVCWKIARVLTYMFHFVALHEASTAAAAAATATAAAAGAGAAAAAA